MTVAENVMLGEEPTRESFSRSEKIVNELWNYLTNMVTVNQKSMVEKSLSAFASELKFLKRCRANV